MPDDDPQAGGSPPAAPVGAGTAPGQPPFGSSPTSVPTPNKGNEAAGAAQLGVIINLMAKALPMLGAHTEPGRVMMKAMTDLGKYVPPGAVSPGLTQTTIEQMLAKQRQAGPQIAAMRGGAPGGAPPGAPPPGAPPMPPPPPGA